MTTVGDLIAFLQRFPSNAIVFTNQYGGDWSEEHPIDLELSEFHSQAYIYRDLNGNLAYTPKESINKNEPDEDQHSIGQQDVVRLVA